MDITNHEIEQLLKTAAEWAIAYRQALGEARQTPAIGYHEARARFDMPTPEGRTPARAVIDELATLAEDGLHAMAGPRFFGWVVGASHPVGVAADWLTSAWGQNAGDQHVAPAAAAAEQTAAGWLLDILDLPPESGVGFVTGATMANTVCLAAARGAVLDRAGWDVEVRGLFGAPPIRILIGEDAHTTVFSALRFLGFGSDQVSRVETDAAGRMRADAFAKAARAEDGPCIAIAQAGQINTGAFDPFAEISEAARGRGAWLHVDGAFGLWARASPARKGLTEGVERADSLAVDGHKWLQIPYDCGYAIVRDEEAHRRAMTITASYLPGRGPGERCPGDYVPELSRRARGFATWAMIRHLGRGGIAEMVERHCEIARRMAERLAAEPGIAVLNDIVLNQVIVRFGDDAVPEEGDRLTNSAIERIQQEAICFVGGAAWRGRRVMRISVISWPTTEDEAERSVAAIIDAWRTVRDG